MAIICLIPTRNVGWVTNFFPINSCILWCLSGGLGLSLNLGLSLIRTGLDSMPSRNINQPDRWRTFPFDSAFSWLQQTITPDFTSICILISHSFFSWFMNKTSSSWDRRGGGAFPNLEKALYYFTAQARDTNRNHTITGQFVESVNNLNRTCLVTWGSRSCWVDFISL